MFSLHFSYVISACDGDRQGKNILSDNVCRRLMAARCDGDEEVRTLYNAYTLNNVTAEA
jgi:hypothetical protein